MTMVPVLANPLINIYIYIHVIYIYLSEKKGPRSEVLRCCIATSLQLRCFHATPKDLFLGNDCCGGNALCEKGKHKVFPT